MSWINKLLGWMFPATTSTYATIANPVETPGYSPGRTVTSAEDPLGLNNGKGTLERIWDDLTGQTQIEQQARANLELSKYQSQMNEEFYNKYSSPDALMRQYQEAGLNPNLMYSSAGSGQGNVPKFDSPDAPRNMSLTDRLSKVVGLYSTFMNLQSMLYNNVAQREVAEQAAIKTFSLQEDLRSKMRTNALKDHEIGFHLDSFFEPRFRRSASALAGAGPIMYSSDSALYKYANAARSLFLNKALNAYGTNYWMNNVGFDMDANKVISPYGARNYWLNQGTMYQAGQRGFDLNWDKTYRTMLKSLGLAGQLGGFILRSLK